MRLGAVIPLLVAAAVVAPPPQPAAGGYAVTVPGTASVWLADQPGGSTVYQNTAPANAPVLIDLGDLGNPSVLSFGVTGATSRSPDPVAYPLVGGDGETPGAGPNADPAWVMPPVFDLSGLTAPYSALVGVFLGPGAAGPPPPSLDFGTPQARSFGELSPLTQQVFFIGDGLTGVGSGSVQTFHVPTGATRLYLAPYDSISSDNVGALRVEVRAPTPVPGPPGAVLAVTGCVGLVVLFGRRWERRPRAWQTAG